PSGYEPDELPDCSIPRLCGLFYSAARACQTLISRKLFSINRLALPVAGRVRPAGAFSGIPDVFPMSRDSAVSLW
ncbi:hypothetical protein, partial [Pseudomonas coleopterorum]|uniref:hypothetical protein n=1 Tax=Pseudomonas coleopterorum TaxID=1605838 RepID=UPI0028AEE95F